MELLPVRSFFAEALASLYVVSGEKATDQRARDLEDRMPTARVNAEGSGISGAGGAAGLGAVEAGDAGAAAAAGGEGDATDLRPRRLRRFRN